MPENKKIRERRQPRRQMTTLAQDEINRQQKAERVQRQLMNHFRAGDWYLTLTFSTGQVPESEEKAKAVLEKFKRALRTLFRKRDKEPIYISVIENLRGRGRCHVHMLIPALEAGDRAQLGRLWPYGHVNVELYGGEALDAYKLSQYFSKVAAKETSSQVMTSRNLNTPEPKKEQVSRAETYSDKIVVPEGYEKVEQLSHTGYTKDGYPYQRVVFQRIRMVYGNETIRKEREKYAGEGKRKNRAGGGEDSGGGGAPLVPDGVAEV